LSKLVMSGLQKTVQLQLVEDNNYIFIKFQFN